MSDQLVVIEKKNVMQIFASEGGLDPVVDAIIKEVRSHKPDTETQKGRDAVRTLANKVAKSKVYLDDLGKDLVSDWKSKSKVVDNSRKKMRDALAELKVEARKPLIDWEEAAAEKERIFQEKAAALKLEESFLYDHEVGLLMDEKHDRDIAEALQKELEAEKERQRLEELAQKEHDEQIAKEAKEQAEKEKIEAEAKAKQAELDKIAIQEKADRDAAAAKEREKQAKIDADNAEKQRLADVKQAEKDATQREVERQKKKKEEEIKAQKKLEANKAHIGKIRKEAKLDLMEILGVEEKLAVSIVMAITKKLISNLSINY